MYRHLLGVDKQYKVSTVTRKSKIRMWCDLRCQLSIFDYLAIFRNLFDPCTAFTLYLA